MTRRGALVTRTDAARALGVSVRALDRLVERGAPGPRPGPRGGPRYDLEAIRSWQNERAEQHRPVMGLAEERARLAAAQTALTEVRRAILAGDLIDRRREEQRDFTLGRTIRDSVLAIPSRVAALLAAESDPEVVDRLLTEELRSALTALAEVLADEKEATRDDEGGGGGPSAHPPRVRRRPAGGSSPRRTTGRRGK